jgi:cytochrome c553
MVRSSRWENTRFKEQVSVKLQYGAFTGIFIVAVSILAQNPGNTAHLRSLPFWAYPVTPAQATPSQATPPQAAGSPVPQHLAGSAASYTPEQITSRFEVPDWFPNAHPPMPRIVAKGREPVTYACGHCHLPNGQGRPENSSVAGLSVDYIEAQMADFKNGLRKSSEPRMDSVTHMIQVAKTATPEEVAVAAAYFSSIKLKPWIRVVETQQVPKTKGADAMLVPADGGGMEPIGERVIEIPEDLKRTELRDPSSGFIAYVPVGSLKRGEALVFTGGNRETIPCTICHGSDLRGLGNVPSIAGRSPSQMARQLIDIQTGARNGAWTQLMKQPVAKLTNDDIVAIVGYLASLKP